MYKKQENRSRKERIRQKASLDDLNKRNENLFLVKSAYLRDFTHQFSVKYKRVYYLFLFFTFTEQ